MLRYLFFSAVSIVSSLKKIDSSSVRFIEYEVFTGLLVATQAKNIDTHSK
jgi:hypothetical protein